MNYLYSATGALLLFALLYSPVSKVVRAGPQAITNWYVVILVTSLLLTLFLVVDGVAYVLVFATLFFATPLIFMPTFTLYLLCFFPAVLGPVESRFTRRKMLISCGLVLIVAFGTPIASKKIFQKHLQTEPTAHISESHLRLRAYATMSSPAVFLIFINWKRETSGGVVPISDEGITF